VGKRAVNVKFTIEQAMKFQEGGREIYLCSLTSANVGVDFQRHAQAVLPARKPTGHVVEEDGFAAELVRTDEENFVLTQFPSTKG